MGADLNCLMGEIVEDPRNLNTNSEELLIGLLKALIREQEILKNRAEAEVNSESTHLC